MNIEVIEITVEVDEVVEVDEITIECEAVRDGCTGHVDVDYVMNIFDFDMYNEVNWQWICGNCQNELRGDI